MHQFKFTMEIDGKLCDFVSTLPDLKRDALSKTLNRLKHEYPRANCKAVTYHHPPLPTAR